MQSAQKLGVHIEQTFSLSDYLKHYLNMIIFSVFIFRWGQAKFDLQKPLQTN